MIITCPSCNTDFSLGSDIVKGMEEPRFHCAICDHYFEIHRSTLNKKLDSAVDAQQLDLLTKLDAAPQSTEGGPQISRIKNNTAGQTRNLQNNDDTANPGKRSCARNAIFRSRRLFNSVQRHGILEEHLHHRSEEPAKSHPDHWNMDSKSSAEGNYEIFNNASGRPTGFSTDSIQVSPPTGTQRNLNNSSSQYVESNVAVRVADWPAPPPVINIEQVSAEPKQAPATASSSGWNWNRVESKLRGQSTTHSTEQEPITSKPHVETNSTQKKSFAPR